MWGDGEADDDAAADNDDDDDDDDDDKDDDEDDEYYDDDDFENDDSEAKEGSGQTTTAAESKDQSGGAAGTARRPPRPKLSLEISLDGTVTGGGGGGLESGAFGETKAKRSAKGSATSPTHSSENGDGDTTPLRNAGPNSQLPRPHPSRNPNVPAGSAAALDFLSLIHI